MSTTTSIPEADAKRFDEAVQFTDEKPPFIGWLPSPRQIREWCAIICEERLQAKREGIVDA